MSYKVTIKYERDVSFFVDAEDEKDIHDFLDDNIDWQPGDIEGLIDLVTEEEEAGYTVEKVDEITANFEVVSGKLQEKQS